MTATNVRYIVIAPVRDEAAYIQRTLESVASQTNLPVQWIIVNDGSTDETGRLIEEAAAKYSWIKAVQRENRGARRAGGGVVEAFYAGLEHLEDREWEYLVKLDGDVTFESDYFERCFEKFAKESRLGIGGGLICNNVGGILQAESKVDPPFHVRGATKIYRRECWQDLGGLVKAPGWDTIDELKANMLGWSTRTFPDIKILHHRPAGAAYGTWSNWVKNGRANYVTGYHPVFMLLKCISRLTKKPYIVAGAGLAWGFVTGYFKGVSRGVEPEVMLYLHRQQMNRLFLKKSLWN
jgi:poly-beta-1,6-N-acetyl-D-glucosamine synthase